VLNVYQIKSWCITTANTVGWRLNWRWTASGHDALA